MNILILIGFMVHLVIVLSDSNEDKSNVKELCSESYFDRLRTTNRFKKTEGKEQVFHLYRSLRSYPGSFHHWGVTVNRSGLNNTLRAVSIQYHLKSKKLPEYQLRIRYMDQNSGVNTSYIMPNLQNDSNEWCTAYGFNALDDHNYFLCEDLTKYRMKAEDRSQYLGRTHNEWVNNSQLYYHNDPIFGKIPVFEFLGIDCPEEEPFITDKALLYTFEALLVIGVVLLLLNSWKLKDRFRIKKEIYADSRLGSLSTTPSATHSSEDTSVIVPIQRRGHLNV